MTRFEHPMHPAIWMLAEKYGVGLANRLTTRHHVYDGKTVATWCALIESGKKYYGGRVLEVRPLSDHDILHEICHYIAASEIQRDLPEFGLGHAAIFGQSYCPEVVDHQESETQEILTQMLCIYFGMKYGINCILSDNADWSPCFSWDSYILQKSSDWQDTVSAMAFQRFISLLDQGIV